jgi:S1-C subfamily serine protease
VTWKDAVFRNLAGDEFSALGIARGANGVLVAQVPPASEAAQAGLRPNDFIEALDGQPIRNAEDFAAKAAKLQRGNAVKLNLVRGQKKQSLVIAPVR